MDRQRGSDHDLDQLETFILRLRQFYKDGEIFHYKNLRRKLSEVTSLDNEFHEYYNVLNNYLNKGVSNRGMTFQKNNGKDLIAGRIPSEIMDLFLYRGRIHSCNLLSPSKELYEGLPLSKDIYDTAISFFAEEHAIRIGMGLLMFRDNINRLLCTFKK